MFLISENDITLMHQLNMWVVLCGTPIYNLNNLFDVFFRINNLTEATHPIQSFAHEMKIFISFQYQTIKNFLVDNCKYYHVLKEFVYFNRAWRM